MNSVANKIIQIVNAKKFFNVDNVKNLTALLISLSSTFRAQSQKQAEWIFPVFFNWRHLYVTWWFSSHMLSDTKSLQTKFNRGGFSDLFRRFLLSPGTCKLTSRLA